MTRARLPLLAFGALLLSWAGVGVVPAPALAADGFCSGAGVNVVVDFGALGGGVQQRCATGGGSRTAYTAFRAAGVSMTEVQRFPGAICQVEGRPQTQCATMPPADAFWGLFSSHGSGWTFSSRGVTSLRVSSGDTVAFAWQAGRSVRRPGVAPAPAVAVHPTSSPTPGGSGHSAAAHPTGRPPASAPSAPPSASPTASPTASPRKPHAGQTLLGRAYRTTGHACGGPGVDVLVDFHQLPGGIRLGCAPDGGGDSAWHAFGAAGVRLAELSAFAGGICRVDGRPAKADCTTMPPADAYWSLYVRTGDTWTYATKGATQLTLADGDVVALSWQQGAKPAPPRLSPALVAAATLTAMPSASPSGPAATGPVTDSSDAADSTDGGLSWFVPVGIVVLLAVGGAIAVLLRRRTGPTGS